MKREAEIEPHEKVFCVGFQKTGTSTLARALRLLGYSVTGPNFISDFKDREDLLQKATKLSGTFNAFQDNPWPLFYREMGEAYPEAKFILTKRNPERWLQSMKKQFSGTTTPMRELIYGYGCPVGREEIFRKIYEDHNKSVLEHFKNAPERFLVLDLEQGFGWQEICSFLGRTSPNRKFPHENATYLRSYNKLKRAVRQALKNS